jgi:hypothetical protein
MASKEVMIVAPEELKNLVPSEKAMDAYKFAIANAGIEMDGDAQADFVVQRNAKTEGFRELAEVQKWMEKTAASIKEALKHTYNVGTEEDLPANVKWSKQSYTYAFDEGQARVIAQSLIDSGLTTKEQLFDAVTVTAMIKAAGITTDKMLELFHDGIVIKPKERTLTVK